MLFNLLCFAGLLAQAAAVSKLALYQALTSEAVEMPSHVEIRSSVKGTVHIVPSAQFRILVNITAEDMAQLSTAHLDYQSHAGGLLLQISEGAAVGDDNNVLSLIYGGVAILCSLSLVVSVVYACIWSRQPSEESLKCNMDDLLGVPAPTLLPETECHQPAAANTNKSNGTVPPDRPQTASSRSIASDPGSRDMMQRRKRRQPPKSGDASSSDEMSSTEDNGWSRQRAMWKLHRDGGRYRAVDRMSDLSADGTSADAGFSSANESAHKQRGMENRKQLAGAASSHEDLEWDTYATIPMELGVPNDITHKWYFSDNEEEKFNRDRKSDGFLGYTTLLAPVGELTILKDIAPPTGGDGTKPKGSPPPDDGYETGHPVHLADGRDTSPPQYPTTSQTSSQGAEAMAEVASPATARRNGGASRSHLNGVMSAAILLGVISGSYCLLYPGQMVVNMTIYLPQNYIDRIYIFTNTSRPLSVEKDSALDKTSVYTFETAEPLLVALGKGLCRDMACSQHCDERTGSCVCSKGYTVYDTTSCADIAECANKPCGRGEKCVNSLGSYSCTCAEGYARNSSGKCIECSATRCPAGTYEEHGCPNRRCLPCSAGCPAEQYVVAECSSKADTQCALCSPPCEGDDYNFVPCTNKTDRLCRPKKELPLAASSGNTIMEPSGKSALVGATSDKWYITPNFQEQVEITLSRSSDVQVLVRVHAMAMHPRVLAVNHANDNDNEAYGGDANVLQRFCPYPMAVKHELLPVLHANVTAASASLPAAVSNCSAEDTDVEDSTYCIKTEAAAAAVDPTAACATYEKFGRTPQLHPQNWSIVCTEADLLPDMFDLASYLSESRVMMVEPSVECAKRHSACDKCAEQCAQDIVNKPAGDDCAIIGDEADNGWSPRLMHCDNCCLETKCREPCASYADRSCEAVRCWNGNLAEFVLTPSFHARTTEFLCHVELAKDRSMMELDYSIVYRGKVVGNYSIRLQHSLETVTRTKWSDGLLSVHYSTGFSSLPDVVQGDIEYSQFSTGFYKVEGQRTVKLPVNRHDVLAAKPFDLSISQWKRQKCNQSIADKFYMTVNRTAYREDRQLSAEPLPDALYEYQIANRSAQPYAYFEVQQNSSIVQRLFAPSEVYPSTLEGSVYRGNGVWKVSVKGQVRNCPGRFVARLWEDEVRLDGPLAEYEVGVRCPSAFTLSFTIPGGEINAVNRVFVIEIGTEEKKIFLPASPEPVPVPIKTSSRGAVTTGTVAEIKASPSEPRKITTISVMGPFLLINGIGVFVLAIAWIVSTIVPRNRSSVSKSKLWKGLCLVSYAVYRTLFAAIGSFTVFVLLWYTFNRKDMAVVQSYGNAVDTIMARQRHDLQRLIDYSLQTIEQQNAAVADMRSTCYKRVTKLHDLSQAMLQNASIELHKRLSSVPQENDLVSRLQERLRLVSSRLQDFRTDYNVFAKRAASKIVTDMKKTIDDLERSKWLSGAKTLRDGVARVRSRRRDTTQPLRDWIGLKSNLNSIGIDFTLPNFPYLDPSSLFLPELSETPEFKPIDLETVFLSTNHFFSDDTGVQRTMELTEQFQAKDSFVVMLTLTTTVVVLILLDLILFAHRATSAMDTSQLILTGRTIHKKYSLAYEDGCPSEKLVKKKLAAKEKKRVRHHLFRLIVNTDFIPKLVTFICAMSAAYVILDVTLTFVTMPAIEGLGLLTTLMGPWNLTSSIASSNIDLNLKHINSVEIPTFEAMYNEYIGQVEYFNALYRNVSYQKWQLECDNAKLPQCRNFPWHKFELPASALMNAQFDCRLSPVEAGNPAPAVITTQDAKDILQPYVDAMQALVATTVYLVAAYATAFLLSDMLGTVLWNFLTRLAALPGERIITVKETTPNFSETVTSHIPFINE